MTVHTISEKGWIVIPAELRRKYALNPGDEVQIVDYGGVLSIIPLKKNVIEAARGMLRSRNPLARKTGGEGKDER